MGNGLKYWLPILLFGICLSATLMLSGEATSNQTNVTNSSLAKGVRSEKALQAKTPELLTKDVRKTVLSNGLTILTKEVHSAPVVSVQVWYKVGSRNEAPGVNGIAHQLEHMMFRGTKDRPIQFGRLFSALGSESNAFTSYDKTAYFDTVERNKLNAVLQLEADRMHNSLINPERLATEKRIVISELQGYENSPGYRLDKAVMREALPNSPYGLPVGGTKADVEKFTADQVKSYYQAYYAPNNATLVIVGDFKTESAIAAVKDIFGKIPKSVVGQIHAESTQQPEATNAVAPNSTTNTTSQSSDTTKTQKPKIELHQPGSAALLQIVYPLPDANNPDVPALDVMDYILTGGRTSRVYQALVQSGLASNAGGGTANLLAGGWYQLEATAAPGKDLNEIDRVLSGTIADLQNQGVTSEELHRAKTQVRATVLLQNRDISSQASQLANDQTVTGDYHYTDKYLAEISKVTVADVKRVAQFYLKEANRKVGFFEPTQVDGKTAGAGTTSTGQTSEHFNLGPPVNPTEVAKYLPTIPKDTKSNTQSLPTVVTLNNNLKVLLLPDRSTPTVALNGYVQAGSEFDTPAKAGLATLTADNLMNGTKTKDALAIAKTLEDRGAELGFSANREGVAFSGNALSADLPTLLDVLADVMQNATFPSNELDLSHQRALTTLKQQLDTPSSLARRTFQQAVYPENHPFHAFPTEDSLKNITRPDVEQFYQEHYQPNTTIMTLVGNFDPKAVQELLETKLGGWKATSQPPDVQYPSVSLPAKVVDLHPVLPGKTQAITYIGYKGIDRKDPHYYAALVMNQIVGGDTLSSRLGTEIRDRQGLTYGIYSYFVAGKHPGPFLISMQTAPEDASKAVARTIALLQEIRQRGLTKEEVAAAKRSLLSSYTVSLSNPDVLASDILMNQVYGLSPEEIRNFPLHIQAVNQEQVNQAAKDLLHPDNLVIVTAGPPVSASR